MILISNIVRDYGSTIIKIKKLVFEDNKSYIILGASGCGKTTLINMIAGLLLPSEGVIEYNKFKIEKNSNTESLAENRRKNIGYISQEFNLFEELSVYDNINLVAALGTDTNNYKDIIGQVGLEGKEKRRVNTLSGGEKQRVAIARALMTSPSIMLCDEPTASLNTPLAKQIVSLLIDSHKKLRNILIVVTHDDRLSPLFDEVIHFDEVGEVLEND